MKICISIAPTAQIPLSETNDIMNLKNFIIARIFTKNTQEMVAMRYTLADFKTIRMLLVFEGLVPFMRSMMIANQLYSSVALAAQMPGMKSQRKFLRSLRETRDVLCKT